MLEPVCLTFPQPSFQSERISRLRAIATRLCVSGRGRTLSTVFSIWIIQLRGSLTTVPFVCLTPSGRKAFRRNGSSKPMSLLIICLACDIFRKNWGGKIGRLKMFEKQGWDRQKRNFNDVTLRDKCYCGSVPCACRRESIFEA